MYCESCKVTIKSKYNWKKHVTTKKHQKNLPNPEEIIEDVIDEDEEINKYQCPYCDKVYKHNQSYYLHINHRCKLRAIKEETERKLKEIKEETEKTKEETNRRFNGMDEKFKQVNEAMMVQMQTMMMHQMKTNEKTIDTISTLTEKLGTAGTTNNTNNTTNNTQNTNTQNNTININVYGQENYKALLSALDVKCLRGNNIDQIVSSIMRIAYIDRKENRNIKYTNERDNKCKVLTANGWESRNVNHVFGERLMSVGKIYPDSLNEYNEETKEDVDDLIELTTQVQSVSKHGDSYVNDEVVKKSCKKDIDALRQTHLTNLYNTK